MEKVEEKLIEYKFNLGSKGFDYWIMAIDIAKKNPNWRIGNIYEEIANTYDTNYKQVEKRMREVINTYWLLKKLTAPMLVKFSVN